MGEFPTGRGRRAFAAAAGFAAVAGLVLGCARSETPAPAKKEADAPSNSAAEQVHVVKASMQWWPRTIRVQGTLIEDEYALLGAKVGGRVKEIRVDIGTRVKTGQVVALLETDEFDLRIKQAEAQVAQARASVGLKGDTPDEKLDPSKAPIVEQERTLLEEARLNVQRVKALAGRSVVTQEEILSREALARVAEARYRSALNNVQEQVALLKLRRSELALANQNLRDAVLKAPFDGIIQETRVAPGSYVNVGEPVAALVRTSPLRFRAGVPERSAVGVDTGQSLRITLEGVSQPMTAKIARISPALDLGSRALIIEADIDNRDNRLRTGLFAEAEILVDDGSQTLAVPTSCVTSFGGVDKVWIVTNNRSQPQPVHLGRRDRQRVEVLSGLKDGDWILTQGDQGREGVVSVIHDPPREGGESGSKTGG